MGIRSLPVRELGLPRRRLRPELSAGSPSLTWNVPVVLSTQRPDGQDPALSISEPAQGALGARMVALSSTAVAGLSSSDADGAPGIAVTDENALWASDPSGPTFAVTAETPSSSSGGFTFRMSTGPFVSRNAGPLGPILASAGRDPTPEVDRNERALYQDIERRGFDAGSGEEYELTGSETGDDEHGGAVGSVLAIPGPGGFPLKVTAPPKHRRSDLSELVSAIPTPAETDDAQSIDSDQLAAAAQASSPADAPAYAHFYIKAACVLALSLGMSSGMLFPDLFASLRRRMPRSFTHRKSNRRPS